MSELLPIGSIIKVDKILFMIIGYKTERCPESFENYYGIVKFPLGFISKESLGLISIKREFEVIYKGYVSEEGEKYIKNKEYIINAIDEMGFDNWNRKEKEIISYLERQNSNE